MQDYNIQRPTRRCHETDQPLRPGDKFFSVLIASGDKIERQDFSAACWQGPPADAVGWWQCEIPKAPGGGLRLAPPDVLLDFFEQLVEDEESRSVAYLLALWLVRKRVLAIAESQPDADFLVCACSLRDKSYAVPVVDIAAEEVEPIQAQFAELLYAGDEE
jgi:hypothetical protein